MPELSNLVTKRHLLVLIVIVGVLLGVGIGFVGTSEDAADQNSVGAAADSPTPSPQPTPPTVSVTPPTEGTDGDEESGESGGSSETETGESTATRSPTPTPTQAPTPTPTPPPTSPTGESDSETSESPSGSSADSTPADESTESNSGTTGETASPTPTGTATESTTTDSETGSPTATPTRTPTATTEPTPTETPSTDTSSPTDSTESDWSGSVDLSAAASDPPAVVRKDGDVDSVRGNLTGNLSWTGSVDDVVVVVSTWTPADGWEETRRVVVDLENRSGPVSLATLFDNPITYAEGERADAFDNPDDDTTVQREGYVAVTAVFFENGTEVARANVTDDYQFAVTNVGTVAVELGGTDEAGLNVTGAAPGHNGTHRLLVENTGETNGSVQLSVTGLASNENGFSPAEALVDQDDSGELAAVLELRMAVVVDGERRYVVGGPSNWTTLASLAEAESIGSFDLPVGESRTVVVDWRIPIGVGNEIQTDGVRFDLTVTLLSDGT